MCRGAERLMGNDKRGQSRAYTEIRLAYCGLLGLGVHDRNKHTSYELRRYFELDDITHHEYYHDTLKL
jgi:hypothetical protein